MNSDERLEHWLAEGDNANEWARMREALSLSEGFALFFAVVPDGVTESLVADLVEVEAGSHNRRIVPTDAALDGDDSAVRRFLSIEANERVLVLLRTTHASRRNVEALERCFVQLNARRDQISARVRGPIVVLLRPDAIRRLLDIAPDLYSVHAAQFRFVQGRASYDTASGVQLPPELGDVPASLRIRLLEIEQAITSGDIIAAAALFDPTLERTEQLFGPAHEVTISVLARGVDIFDRSDRPERAKQLADECWRQLQYADAVREQTLSTLAHFYAEYGPAPRLQAIQTRWEQVFPDRPWPLAARQAPA